MSTNLLPNLYSLLRLSLGLAEVGKGAFPKISEEEWKALLAQSVKFSIVGLAWQGVQKLPADLQPPRQIALKWSFLAEKVCGMNQKANALAAELTQKLESLGYKSVILKGQANARLYPSPDSRQVGDIDILLDGGRKAVSEVLVKLEVPKSAVKYSPKHAGVDESVFGLEVELHFAPTNSFSPFSDRRLHQFLTGEFARRTLAPEGFYVPTVPYALVMQLGHIKQHFFSAGIGPRQLIDYHQLLMAATDEERRTVGEKLHSLGLFHMAGAVMWVLQQVLGLERVSMLCDPDETRGKKLLHVIETGGNFGWYAPDYKVPLLKRWLHDRKRTLRMLKFDFSEAFWHEVRYWCLTISLIPRRIKQRRIGLGKR